MQAPRVGSVGLALPEHRYDQETLIKAFEVVLRRENRDPAPLARLHRAVKVEGRNLALSIDEYLALKGFGDANDAFIRVGTDLAAQATSEALERAKLNASEIDAVFFTTVTGLATPTIDARLMNRLPFRPNVKRTPLFGLGCVGGRGRDRPNA